MGRMSLIVVVGFNIIFAFMGFNLSGVASHSYSNYTNYYSVEQAQFMAESGANVAIGTLYQNSGWLFNDSSTHKCTLNLSGATATYSIKAKRSYTNGTYVTFYIASTYNGLSDSSTVVCNIPSYSSYAMYTVSDNGILWTTGEKCNGKLHADSILSISGTPYFSDYVTVGNSVSGLVKSDSPAVFKKGYQTGIKLGWVNNFDAVKYSAGYDSIANGPVKTYKVGSNTVKYQADVYIQLNSDGSIDIDTGGHRADGLGWATAATDPHKQHLVISSMTNPVIGVMCDTAQSHIHVRGTMTGKLTIANLGSGNVFIDSSIYEKDTTKDILGLVARDTMMVTDDSINNVGSVHVQGALLAATFTAQDYSTRNANTKASGNGTLSLYGALAQNSRGAVGSGTKGFLKNYTYDNRFAGNGGPPSYPTLPYFQIMSWYDKMNWNTSWWSNW